MRFIVGGVVVEMLFMLLTVYSTVCNGIKMGKYKAVRFSSQLMVGPYQWLECCRPSVLAL